MRLRLLGCHQRGPDDIMEIGPNSLPWTTLLILASGYAGYFIANIGMRDQHKTIDVIFSTIVFGFFGALAFHAAMARLPDVAVAGLVAFGATAILGALWSKLGRFFLTFILRKTNVTYNDDLPTAFDALISETGTDATQVTVKVGEDWLMCDKLADYAGHPNGPLVLGRSGDVLMYVTHIQHGDSEFEKLGTLTLGKWGTEVTYIPADQVSRISIRRKWRKSPSS